MTIVQITDSIDKACMIGIWIETLLYGINCVMYALCMFILLRERRVPATRWVLLVMPTILFLLCTAHVGQSLQQLLDVFIYAPADVVGYSMIYWSDFSLPPRVVKDVLFCTLVLAQNFIQIWRLYVVFMYNWKVAVFPSVLLVACVGSAYAAVVISALPLQVGVFYGSMMNRLLIVACALEVTVNIFVTLAIVTRLWWMGQKSASLRASRTNPFASSIYIVIESGAISTALSIMFLAFAVPSITLALIGLDVLAQLDVFVPLLVIVQVALTERHRSRNSGSFITTISAQDKITFKPGVPREQDCDSLENLLLRNVRPRSPTVGPASDSDVGV